MKIDPDDLCPCGSGLRFKRCCQDEENQPFPESPEELLAERFAALQNGDFERLHASYHPDSPFLQQFYDRGAYVNFARQQLRGIRLRKWQRLDWRRLDAQRVEQLLAMEISVDGGTTYLYELALLVLTGAGWRYHSAQKLSGEDYQGPPEKLDFHHFDNAVQKIRY